MSTQDELARLKALVQVYEKELNEIGRDYPSSYDESNYALFHSRMSYSSAKLIEAYREYTAGKTRPKLEHAVLCLITEINIFSCGDYYIWGAA
jgi:hypothetical protein